MQQYLRSRYLVPKTVRTQTSTGNLVPFITLGNIDFLSNVCIFCNQFNLMQHEVEKKSTLKRLNYHTCELAEIIRVQIS